MFLDEEAVFYVEVTGGTAPYDIAWTYALKNGDTMGASQAISEDTRKTASIYFGNYKLQRVSNTLYLQMSFHSHELDGARLEYTAKDAKGNSITGHITFREDK